MNYGVQLNEKTKGQRESAWISNDAFHSKEQKHFPP